MSFQGQNAMKGLPARPKQGFPLTTSWRRGGLSPPTRDQGRRSDLAKSTIELQRPGDELRLVSGAGLGCFFCNDTNLSQIYFNMAAEQRKLLEQLMGASSSSRVSQVSLSDPKVCRSYVAGTCPHDLFTNTKQDLGPCPKVHSEALKAEFEGLSEREKQKYGFEYDYMRDLQKYIDECNRRIETAQRRLEKTPDEIRQTNVLVGSSVVGSREGHEC